MFVLLITSVLKIKKWQIVVNEYQIFRICW